MQDLNADASFARPRETTTTGGALLNIPVGLIAKAMAALGLLSKDQVVVEVLAEKAERGHCFRDQADGNVEKCAACCRRFSWTGKRGIGVEVLHAALRSRVECKMLRPAAA